MSDINSSEIHSKVKELSTTFNSSNEVAIILAAGHGKRIKSQKSKMLHKIWEIPTVERVYNACHYGIENINSIIVVGIKAQDVMEVIGKRASNKFAYQEVQNGTGHAVQVALKEIMGEFQEGIVYVLPGDMGLLDDVSMSDFRNEFINSDSDMMVLTGIFEGDPMLNSYGRILRVKTKDDKGNDSGKDSGKVIQIMEYKDILALKDDVAYKLNYKNKSYSFSKKEL
jgi:bifunctional UDP-N-acetylglucosamine pyrophosphorylase/glucosamine-1-phosphate N-acetyltransferase